MSGKTLPLPPKTPTEVSPNATNGIEMRKMDNYSFSTEEPSMKEAHNFS
jgi:hypothetical protein